VDYHTFYILIFAILEIVFVVRVRKDIIESFSFKCQTQFAETILVLS